ncbi:MAG: sigma-70 family RNA polymerase sigma factor [Bacteroidetes bacterium]|nr:MAG: sigma-70 family RNA polymerase sigma factor [Bacteroidota bacterium]
MQYTDDYLIEEIRAGGSRQEKGIRHLYEQFFYIAQTSQQKFRPLQQDEVFSAYNAAIIALRKQVVNGVFRGDSALSTYLTRIFTNKCIDLLRQRKGAQLTADLEYATEVKDETPNALVQLVQSDQIEQIQEFLQRIGDICKQILLDSEYYGYSAEEIAERIGFSNAASVNSKKYTCLQKLRKAMFQ